MSRLIREARQRLRMQEDTNQDEIHTLREQMWDTLRRLRELEQRNNDLRHKQRIIAEYVTGAIVLEQVEDAGLPEAESSEFGG